VQSEFVQGSFKQTGGQLDVAIEGPGFFQVMDPNGMTYYTRAGNFSKNANGNLVLGSANMGRLLQPPITIPPDAIEISISPEGMVSVRQPGSQNMSQIGQIELAMFVNPQGLLKLGENLYAETDASGAPTLGNPGQDGLGLLRQNSLEASNVEPVHELIDLITTQRAFELNAQAVKAGDEMMQTVANLRRY
jgi:flagellar basal-body rod protein FlgG